LKKRLLPWILRCVSAERCIHHGPLLKLSFTADVFYVNQEEDPEAAAKKKAEREAKKAAKAAEKARKEAAKAAAKVYR